MDRYFVEIGVPLVARQMAAIAEACFDLGDNRVVPTDRAPRQGCYSGDDLILRVISWYDQTYGQALTIRDWLPHALVTIRGEHWQMNFPVVIGNAIFFAGDIVSGPAMLQVDGRYRNLPPGASERADSTLRSFDVVSFIDDFPPGLRSKLHRGELTGLLYEVCRSRVFAHAIVGARGGVFMEEAMADLGSAIDFLLKRPPQPGSSQWSSLQASEKALKSFLTQQGVSFPTKGAKGHDVAHLGELVRTNGGPAFAPHLLAEVACSASVRYDRTLVSDVTARRAHSVALEVAGTIAMALRGLGVTANPSSGQR